MVKVFWCLELSFGGKMASSSIWRSGILSPSGVPL